MNKYPIAIPSSVASLDEWIVALAHPDITEDTAKSLYGNYFDERCLGQLQPSVLPHIWAKYKTQSWEHFVTRIVQDTLASFSTRGDSRTFDIIQSCVAFWPIVQLCKDQVDENYYPQYAKPLYREKLRLLISLANGFSATTRNEKLLEIGVGVLNGKSYADCLLAVDDWSYCWVLPQTALVSLFADIAKDQRFSKGGENDLRLCSQLSLDSLRIVQTEYCFETRQHHRDSDPVYMEMRHLTQRSTENQYWRYMLFAFLSTPGHSWPEQYQGLLDSFVTKNTQYWDSEWLRHVQQVVEQEPGKVLPGWVLKLFEHIPTIGTREDLWLKVIPEYTKNHATWNALGLNAKEQARACAEIFNASDAETDITIPDSLSF